MRQLKNIDNASKIITAICLTLTIFTISSSDKKLVLFYP